MRHDKLWTIHLPDMSACESDSECECGSREILVTRESRIRLARVFNSCEFDCMFAYLSNISKFSCSRELRAYVEVHFLHSNF